MRLSPRQLPAHLETAPLLPVYLLTGDEPLQIEEAADAIRAAARATGFTQREVLEAGSGFDWNALTAEAATTSLFAEKKLIDLRLPSGKPGREGGKALADYCADPPPDTLLLLSLPRLDRQQQSSKWFRAIDRCGAVIQVWPIKPRELPRWIAERLHAAGFRPDREAVRVLAERIEGNLLAARQEIEKLRLICPAGPLDAATVLRAVNDSARFDVFALAESALQGDARRSLRVLEGLRQEGTAPQLVAWALCREVRAAAMLAGAGARGVPPARIFEREKISAARRGPLQRAIELHPRPGFWHALLADCQRAESAAKGVGDADPWRRFDRMVLRLGNSARLPE